MKDEPFFIRPDDLLFVSFWLRQQPLREGHTIGFVLFCQTIHLERLVGSPLEAFAENGPDGAVGQIQVVTSFSNAILLVLRELFFYALDVLLGDSGSSCFVSFCSSRDTAGLIKPFDEPREGILFRHLFVVFSAEKLDDKGTT